MPARIVRLEYDPQDGVVVATSDGLQVELLPYSTWRADGDELRDAGQAGAVRLGAWVVATSRSR